MGQNKSLLKTDFNTIYICIDSISYKNLCQNKYLKDTLFLCREKKQETNTDSYTGKYLIGESSTLEVFQPQNTNHIGDHWGDWGIEFKTRNINILDAIITQYKFFDTPIDTFTTKIIVDSLQIPWYKALNLKNLKNELTILEYQRDYLDYLGFTKKQITQPMTFKEYNSILSNGNNYPRQFSMVTRIKMFADNNLIENLQIFANLNDCRIIENKLTNGVTTIEYKEVDTLPEFPIQEIEISLLNDQISRIEEVSENLHIKISGKIATFIFKNNY